MEDKNNIRGALNSSDISLGKIYLTIKAAQEAKQEQTVHQVGRSFKGVVYNPKMYTSWCNLKCSICNMLEKRL